MRKIALLGEDLVQRLVERARRGEVAAERLLDDHPRVLRAARRAQSCFDHRREHAGRDGQVVRRPLRAVRARCAGWLKVAGSP